jgi:hypothetical protein
MHPVMTMLASGISLTLMLDLLRSSGPDSEVICLTELPPDAGAHLAVAGA